jgi:hypothetical protein
MTGWLAAGATVVGDRLEQMVTGRLEHGTARIRRTDGTIVDVEFRVGATRSGGLPHYVFVFWQRTADRL